MIDFHDRRISETLPNEPGGERGEEGIERVTTKFMSKSNTFSIMAAKLRRIRP
jgi:hypothetical protein